MKLYWWHKRFYGHFFLLIFIVYLFILSTMGSLHGLAFGVFAVSSFFMSSILANYKGENENVRD